MTQAKGKYLYCITKSEKPKKFEIKGIEGNDVYLVSEGKLSAVVSDSEIKEYLITRENVITHQKVIEAVSQKYDVLPVSFGTVSANSKELKEKILKPKAKEFLGALKEVEGKVELGLKAFWIDMNSIFQEIAKSSPTIQRFKNSQDVSYQDKIRAGEIAADLLGQKREEEKSKILNVLVKIAEETKEDKILGDDMILSAAFLVKKSREKAFDKEVSMLGKKYDQSIKFMYVGPLPPYNFIKLELSLT